MLTIGTQNVGPDHAAPSVRKQRPPPGARGAFVGRYSRPYGDRTTIAYGYHVREGLGLHERGLSGSEVGDGLLGGR